MIPSTSHAISAHVATAASAVPRRAKPARNSSLLLGAPSLSLRFLEGQSLP